MYLFTSLPVGCSEHVTWRETVKHRQSSAAGDCPQKRPGCFQKDSKSWLTLHANCAKNSANLQESKDTALLSVAGWMVDRIHKTDFFVWDFFLSASCCCRLVLALGVFCQRVVLHASSCHYTTAQTSRRSLRTSYTPSPKRLCTKTGSRCCRIATCYLPRLTRKHSASTASRRQKKRTSCLFHCQWLKLWKRSLSSNQSSNNCL